MADVSHQGGQDRRDAGHHTGQAQVNQAQEEAAGQTLVSSLDWPKYPFVKVKIIDLIGDERNIYRLLTRCSQSAARSQFVPWGMIIKFNLEVLSAPNWTIAWGVAVHWFDTTG